MRKFKLSEKEVDRTTIRLYNAMHIVRVQVPMSNLEPILILFKDNFLPSSKIINYREKTIFLKSNLMSTLDISVAL